MKKTSKLDRRRFLIATTSIVGAFPGLTLARADEKMDSDEGVTAPEDLMKEHGVLNRCLLIYEEGMRRLQKREDISPEVFQQTAQLIRTFVEGYHEKNEEKYIFPEFERAKKLVDLVETLKTQHQAGRDVTARILALSQPAKFRTRENQVQLLNAC